MNVFCDSLIFKLSDTFLVTNPLLRTLINTIITHNTTLLNLRLSSPKLTNKPNLQFVIAK